MTNDTTRSARTRKPDRARVQIHGAWTAIPNKLLLDTRLSREARLLGALLFLHAGNAGKAFPSQEKLAEELDCTRRSVQRWLEELQAAGWVEWQRTLHNNLYTLKDPDEVASGPANPDQNEILTDATQGSHGIAMGHAPHVTQGSRDATPESHPYTTPESHPTMIQEDSWDLDSSSSDSTPTHHPDDDDDVVTYLREQGITAAEEFRGLDLDAVRERVTRLQRDPNCRPGAIVMSLRTNPPRPAQARSQGSIDVTRYTSGAYGDLFRGGGDVSDLEDGAARDHASN